METNDFVTKAGKDWGGSGREWLEYNRGLTDKQRALLWGTVYNSEW